MTKTIKKEMSVGDCYKIVSWYTHEIEKRKNGEDNLLDKLSNLLQWKLHRNISVIQDTAIAFEKYSKKAKKEFDEKWFNEEKAEYNEETQKEKIKDEFLEDYKADLKRFLEETVDVLNEKTEYEISAMDVEYEIENIINKMENPDFNEIEVLFFMNEPSD